MGPEDVLPLSKHLHAVTPECALMELTGAGKLLDEANAFSDSSIPAALPQPVGLLYREEGVNALRPWLQGLSERSREYDRLRAVIDRAAVSETPLLRLYDYAAQELESIVIVVSARKEFLFWDTEMSEGSTETLADMSVLWTIGQAPLAIPRRSEILWRPRRLELADVQRLREWLHQTFTNTDSLAALRETLSFIDSASIDRAAIHLEAFCTDSPEAQ
jgi:hypothetical protein